MMPPHGSEPPVIFEILRPGPLSKCPIYLYSLPYSPDNLEPPDFVLEPRASKEYQIVVNVTNSGRENAIGSIINFYQSKLLSLRHPIQKSNSVLIGSTTFNIDLQTSPAISCDKPWYAPEEPDVYGTIVAEVLNVLDPSYQSLVDADKLVYYDNERLVTHARQVGYYNFGTTS